MEDTETINKNINKVEISGRVKSNMNIATITENGKERRRGIFTLSSAYGEKKYSRIIVMVYDKAVDYAQELCKFDADVYIKGVLSGKSIRDENSNEWVQKTCVIANRIYADKNAKKEDEIADKES